MNEKILVTYASQGGSTAGVAEAIAQELSKQGLNTEVRPVDEVKDLTPYRAVIIGSAVHSGKWMPVAQSFIDRNQAVLRKIPTAVFQVCMMLATGKEQYERMVSEWLDPLRAQIQPVAASSFAGALLLDNYTKMSEKLGLRIFLAAIKLKSGDYRDWNAINRWTEHIQPLLCR